MYKFIAAVILMVACTQGDVQILAVNNSPNCINSTENYLNLNRQFYQKTVLDYDNQLSAFKQVYLSNLETITNQRDMLLDSINQENESLTTLESLNDLSKKCVAKYRKAIPTIYNTQFTIDNCVSQASGQLNNLIANPTNTRNYLNSYQKTFELEIKECDRKFGNLPLNYTRCITDVVSDTNAYTIDNQKTFNAQMAASNCTAKANIKKAIDCSFLSVNHTLSSIAVTNSLIDICIFGLEGCRPGVQVYSCPQVYHVKRSEVDSNQKTIVNPFYGGNNQYNCVNMQIF